MEKELNIIHYHSHTISLNVASEKTHMFNFFKQIENKCELCKQFSPENGVIVIDNHRVITNKYCIFCLKKIENGFNPEKACEMRCSEHNG